ncbi:hypothetical protein [Kribbella sp.]|uniref:hypothetical protein n=1 Tax=Kribbella sp. TaxID=1871183 RepID=UPI002D66BC3A|nr:hypothetical protein [Kribbella sp.]HZX06299.1 hypothetical protein [Kribbella sp.]
MTSSPADTALPPAATVWVRRAVVLLFANLVASAIFAALTLTFTAAVVDYQLAHGSTKTAEELRISIWIRASMVLVIAAFYWFIARRMRRGRRGAYVRVRTLSIAGVVAVGYLLLTGAYPGWLRSVQVVQLLLLAALVVITNLKPVRAAFPRQPKPPKQPGAGKAAWTLVLVTPLVAEFSLGTVPVRMLYLVLMYIPIYGAGALLIRELARRAGGGWPTIALLGVCYGLLEEGLALQSLTSPHLYGAAAWGPRVLGINTTYTELNLPYHVVFSVVIPIALVELMFRRVGKQPYLRRGGMVITAFVTLLGAVLLRLAVPPTEDPNYQMPAPAILTVVAIIIICAVVALGILPRRPLTTPAPSPTPVPALVGVVCGVATLGYLALLFPIGGARQPAFAHGNWVLVPMAMAAAVGIGTAWLLARWSAGPAWTERHRAAAIGAALIAHSVFGLITRAKTMPDRLLMAAVLVALCLLTARLTTRRSTAKPATA